MSWFFRVRQFTPRGRTIATLNDIKGKFHPEDFTLIPDFLSLPEQRILLTAALQKLDSIDSRQARRMRRAYDSPGRCSVQSCSVQDMFLPDHFYRFEEVNILKYLMLRRLNT
jgi:hypothetical protein